MHLLDDRSPIASLSFARPNGTRDFSAADEAVLVRAEPWIAHALAYPGPFQEGQEITDWHGSDRGALVLDENGHLVASCSTGYRLLQQAAGVGATGRRDARLAVDALAKRLVDTVLSSLRGRGVEPPLLVVLNPYGRFKLRAYCLETFFEGQTPQVALHIERQIPTSLRLFRSPRFLSLAPRERDVCLWLVRGRTTGEIAALLGIKPASVIHYTRSLYARLKVGSKRDLLLALLGPTED
nr:helix-turn-helix transcriptional regulator [Thiocystis minor]